MKNKYEIRGDVTAIFLKSKKYGDMETSISTSKLGKANEHESTWYPQFNPHTNSFYAVGNGVPINGKRKHLRLHRWITGAPTGMEVDHLDHVTLNNADSNLRVVTPGENQQNLKGARTHSKSGIRGVSWCRFNKKWRSIIHVNKKQICIGYFISLEQAEIEVIEARKTHMPFSQEASGL